MRQTVVLHGASDDVVVVAGAVQEEFYAYEPDQGVVTFSNGTRLHLKLVGEFWEIEVVDLGGSTVEVVNAPEKTGVTADSVPGMPDYSARATVRGEFTWIEVNDDGGRGPRRVKL